MGLLAWPPNMAMQERGTQDVKTEAAMFVIPSTESHTLSLPQCPTGHTGSYTRVSVPGGIYICEK